MSRGNASGFEARTQNNFEPTNLLSGQMRHRSVYNNADDSKDGDQSMSNYHDGPVTTLGTLSNNAPVNRDTS